MERYYFSGRQADIDQAPKVAQLSASPVPALAAEVSLRKTDLSLLFSEWKQAVSREGVFYSLRRPKSTVGVSVPKIRSQIEKILKVGFVPQYVLFTRSGQLVHRWDGIRPYDKQGDAAQVEEFFASHFNQIEPFVLHDYVQTKLLGNKIDRALASAKFMIAVARAMLDSFEKSKHPPKSAKF